MEQARSPVLVACLPQDFRGEGQQVGGGLPNCSRMVSNGLTGAVAVGAGTYMMAHLEVVCWTTGGSDWSHDWAVKVVVHAEEEEEEVDRGEGPV